MLLVFFMTAAVYVLIACIIADDGAPVFKLLAASGLSHVTLLFIAGDSMLGMAAIFVLALLGPFFAYGLGLREKRWELLGLFCHVYMVPIFLYTAYRQFMIDKQS